MQNFTTKRKALFACLDDASKELKGTSLDQGSTTSTSLKRSISNQSMDKNLSFMRGKESIFKKPERPITRCLKARRTPDYQINPHKWKKYSLSDVDISDHTNTAAAFAFLKEMDEQRESNPMECNSLGDTNLKIKFKKSSKISRHIREIESNEVADAEVDRPKLKGSKLIMPEYVVGQRQSDKKKKSSNKSEKQERAAGTLKLSHLQESDYSDDDGEDYTNER